MRYFSKANIYKASNVSFNPDTLEARSYQWWIFVKVINNRLIFNRYAYSVTTRKHQSKVRTLLSQLGHRIDHEIECPDGLQNIANSIPYYENLINNLKKNINKPRSNKIKNVERLELIKQYKKKIVIIKDLMIL